MLKEERRRGICGHPLSRYNDGPLCLHCEENRWDLSIDPFERIGSVKLYGLTRIKDEKGITWAQLARKTGFNVNAIKNWGIRRTDRNRDIGACSYEKAEIMARALGVTVEELKRP